MSQPFYQPARQSFSFSQNMQQPQGFGGGQGFGGFQQQSWGGGFGGNQGFGGFGGGGFQPQGFGFGGGYGGGFGGFQPQQQFNPYQGGFGGFGGFGGGYNPMFGGIGGLGFNPMMGPQFGMPMQGFGGFNPYQQQMQQNLQFAQQRDQALAPTHQAAQQAIRQNPAYAQLQQLQSQFRDANPNPEQLKQIQDLQSQIESNPEYTSAKTAHENAMQQFQAQRQQPMYGGIGGLGFNPMMGPQFGMPMQGMQAEQTPEAARRAYMSLSPEARAQQDRVSAMSMPERQMYFQNVDQQARAQSQADYTRYLQLQSRGMFA